MNLVDLKFDEEHVEAGLAVGGEYRWEICEPDGRVVDDGMFKNGITTVGLNDMLDKYFNNGTPPSAWYTGLISTTSFDELLAADTMSSHAGWTESTGYSESTRPEWTAGAAASGVLTNANPVVFTASSDITVTGLFIASNNTKGGTTGILWSTGLFGTDKTLNSGQTLKVYYDLRARAG